MCITASRGLSGFRSDSRWEARAAHRGTRERGDNNRVVFTSFALCLAAALFRSGTLTLHCRLRLPSSPSPLIVFQIHIPPVGAPRNVGRPPGLFRSRPLYLLCLSRSCSRSRPFYAFFHLKEGGGEYDCPTFPKQAGSRLLYSFNILAGAWYVHLSYYCGSYPFFILLMTTARLSVSSKRFVINTGNDLLALETKGKVCLSVIAYL